MNGAPISNTTQLVDYLIRLDTDYELRRRASLQGLIDTAKWIRALENVGGRRQRD